MTSAKWTGIVAARNPTTPEPSATSTTNSAATPTWRPTSSPVTAPIRISAANGMLNVP